MMPPCARACTYGRETGPDGIKDELKKINTSRFREGMGGISVCAWVIAPIGDVGLSALALDEKSGV